MLDEFEVEFWETGKDLVDETPSSSQSGGFECRGRHPLQAGASLEAHPRCSREVVLPSQCPLIGPTSENSCRPILDVQKD